MSEHYVNQPEPGASSVEGAYSRDPQNPTYYFKDNNQFGIVNSPEPAPHPVPDAAPAHTPQAPTSAIGSWFALNSADYLKGLVLGAGVALLATSPTVRKAVVSGTVKVWAAVQGGVEELKEQVQDAKAELSRQD